MTLLIGGLLFQICGVLVTKNGRFSGGALCLLWIFFILQEITKWNA